MIGHWMVIGIPWTGTATFRSISVKNFGLVVCTGMTRSGSIRLHDLDQFIRRGMAGSVVSGLERDLSLLFLKAAHFDPEPGQPSVQPDEIENLALGARLRGRVYVPASLGPDVQQVGHVA